jgi:hypothetical protein
VIVADPEGDRMPGAVDEYASHVRVAWKKILDESAAAGTQPEDAIVVLAS